MGVVLYYIEISKGFFMRKPWGSEGSWTTACASY
jgi:hypothetical protein